MTKVVLKIDQKREPICEGISREALQSVLVPWNSAKPGDFVAFSQPSCVPIDSRYPRLQRHQVFYRKTKDGVEWVDYRRLHMEDHPLLSKAAHLSVTVLNDRQIDTVVRDNVNHMNPLDGEEFWADIVFLPTLAGVVIDAIAEKLIQHADNFTLDQADYSSHFVQAVMVEPKSSHEVIEIQGAIDQDLSALTAIVNCRDQNGDQIQLTYDKSSIK